MQSSLRDYYVATVVSHYAKLTSSLLGTVKAPGKQAVLSELQQGIFNYAQGIIAFYPLCTT